MYGGRRFDGTLEEPHSPPAPREKACMKATSDPLWLAVSHRRPNHYSCTDCSMSLIITFIALALAVVLMPDVFTELAEGALENPVFGVGLLAILVLVGVWIDRG